MEVSQRTLRRLRRTLIGVSMLCAVLVLVVVAVLLYWRLYLLEPSGDPFTRGPYLVALSEHGARLRWQLDRDRAVDLRAVSDGGDCGRRRRRRLRRPASRNRLRLDGQRGRPCPRLRPLRDRARRPDPAGRVRRDRRLRIGQRSRVGGRPGAVGGRAAVPAVRGRQQLSGRAAGAARPQYLPAAGGDAAGAPLWATMGEHDLVWRSGAASPTRSTCPAAQGRYQVRYGPIQIVAAGPGGDRRGRGVRAAGAGRAWPVGALRAVHRPLHADNPLLAALRADHVAAVFAGHLHRYERRTVGGVLQFTVGTSGQGAGDERVHQGDARRGGVAARLRAAARASGRRRNPLHIRGRARARARPDQLASWVEPASARSTCWPRPRPRWRRCCLPGQACSRSRRRRAGAVRGRVRVAGGRRHSLAAAGLLVLAGDDCLRAAAADVPGSSRCRRCWWRPWRWRSSWRRLPRVSCEREVEGAGTAA